MTTNQIREIWLNYFKEKNHLVQENKSLVPVNDNSLLFINSGVATIKQYLDGREKPEANKICNSQRSLRTNDIENVGKTSRHHTLFEMLGNFSIGDYFKDEAIEYAYEILTSEKWFNLDVNDLYFTVHPSDKESYDKWISLGIKKERIVKTEENFWEIGKGPGGPNTEIFFDRGEKYDTRDPYALLEADLENDRVIEIWNIVFSQYNCDPENKERSEYEELPQKNIDTGMGLERMACILQDAETNFETDNFQKIIKDIEKLTNIKYEDNKYPFRVIADHIRALVFAISDGVKPSNEGRGYILRRLIRRSVTVAYLDLNIKDIFLENLVDIIVEINKDIDSNLIANTEKVKEIIVAEEKKFYKTINQGMKLVFKVIEEEKEINGDNAFKLYDTYGFPIEITLEIAENNNVEVDLEGFKSNMEIQRNKARSAQKKTNAINTQSALFTKLDVDSEFVGYDTLSTKAVAVVISDGEKELTKLSEGQEGYLVFNKTPFYAEMGGQVADSGFINNSPVLDVQRAVNGQHVHKIIAKADIIVGDIVSLKVNKFKRSKVSKNHSATHILNYALRKVLGDDVHQAGSYNDETKIRFDFTYDKAITFDELKEIHKIIREQINLKRPITVTQTTLDKAKEMGAIAQFENKYGNIVRVVQIADSTELCGGTHVSNTSTIHYGHILSESSIGSGVRRIEAITSNAVLDYEEKLLEEFETFIEDSKLRLEENKKIDKSQLKKYYEKIEILHETTGAFYTHNLEQLLELEKQLKEKKNNKKQNASIDSVKEFKEQVISKKQQENEVTKFEYEFNEKEDNINVNTIRSISDELVNEFENTIVILSLKMDKKIMFVVKVSKGLTDTYKADEILNEKLSVLGGKGGGNPQMAQGGAQLQ